MRYSLRRLGLRPASCTFRQIPQSQLREYHGTTTPLEQLILGSIKASGPISVANYMQLCLAHPIHGYYMKGDPLGVSGDFITSPEISQVFGELVAIWFLSTLQSKASARKSKGIRLVELGPGRGTLMSDILRVFRGPLASSYSVQSVHMVETSAALRAKQKDTLSVLSEADISRSSAPPLNISWHEQIDDVPADLSPAIVFNHTNQPDTHTLVIANEFFDALPVHVFEKARDGWHEVLVDRQEPASSIGTTSILQPSTRIISSSLSPPNHLRFVLSHSPVPVPAITTNPRFAKLENGTRIEYSRAAVSIMRKIGRLISNEEEAIEDAVAATASNPDLTRVADAGRGMAILIDYGADHLFSNSLRGVRSHRIVDPFDEPGNSDLTSNVDFATLRDALAGLSNVFAHGPTSQHDFLMKMGLEPRLATLMMQGTRLEERREDLRAAAMKLVDMGPQGMGRKFQFMALTNNRETPYPFP